MNKVVLVCVSFLLAFTIAGCGKKTEPNEIVNVEKPQEMVIAEFDGNFATFTYPSTWKVTEEGSLVILEKEGTNMAVLLEIMNNPDGDPELEIMSFAEQYGGTPAEVITYGNNTYHKTFFQHGNVEQTMLITKQGDNLVTITMQGSGHAFNQNIIDTLNSIQFNF